VCEKEGEASTNCSRGQVQKRLLQQRLRVPGSRRHSLYRNKTTGRNGLTEAESGTVHMLRRSLKEKKSLTIDDWGAMEGAAKTDGRRARGKMDRVKRKR